jgi:predicted ABC-class ATPase
MKSYHELKKILNLIDGKGYKAYKDLQGQYCFENFILVIDYVQGDPFASPSRIRVTVPAEVSRFPAEFYSNPYKRRAAIDFLSRITARNIDRFYQKTKGSGKSGLLSIGHCGQEILERNYIIINNEKVEARLEVGLPAAGRRILGKEAGDILLNIIPMIVETSLLYDAIDKEKLLKQVQLVEDQYYLRQELVNNKLVAFIANGSILPRESGISQRPMIAAVPFQSPAEYEIEISLPNYGSIKGMGIPEGITLIVGGGFHGKSTLLKALQFGVYDHIAGDGREYIITRENAV